MAERGCVAATCSLAFALGLWLAPSASATSFPATPATLGQIPPEDDELLEVEFPVSGLAADVPGEVSVSLAIDHAFAGDVVAELVAPTGARTVLFSSPNSNLESSDFGGTYRFSDRAPATPTLPGALELLAADQVLPSEGYRATNGAGVIHPISSAFSGVTNPNGTWTVEVTDVFPAQDTGSVTAASLELVGAVPATPDSLGAIPNGLGPAAPNQPRVLIFPVSGLPLGAPADIAVSITATHTAVGELEVLLEAPDLSQATVFSRTGAALATAPGDNSDLSGTYRFFDAAPAAPTWWGAAATAGFMDPVPPGAYRPSAPGGAGGTDTPTQITPEFDDLADPNGLWALRVRDFFSGAETGSITAASLGVVAGSDITAPAAPTLVGTTPEPPSNSNAVKVYGGAETGAMVRLYLNGNCSGLASLVGTAADYGTAGGIAFTVGSDAVHTISASQYDTSGNVSDCSSTALTYTEDSTAPDTPSIVTTDPPSPADDEAPKIRGITEDGSTVRIYDGDCSGTPLKVGSAALFNAVATGIPLDLDPDEDYLLRVSATDEADNVSGCSEPYTYIEDSTAPETSASTPKPKVKTTKRKVSVRFDMSADEVDVTFQCSLDDAPFAPCDPTEGFKLKPGKHALSAFATDAVGHEDDTPAEVAVKVVRKKH
jgi:subtilisin-like proprotein convertase family protein